VIDEANNPFTFGMKPIYPPDKALKNTVQETPGTNPPLELITVTRR
jgi:hypothetical protein